MEDFAKNLASEYWWLSVVVVSFIINVLSAFLFRHLDTGVGKVSSWWRIRSESRARKFQEEVAALKENYLLLQVYFHAESRERLRVLTSLVTAVLCLVLVSVVRAKVPVNPVTLFGVEDHLIARRTMELVALVSIAIGMSSQMRAIRHSEIIAEAMRTRGQ